jgi:hypothetical protein
MKGKSFWWAWLQIITTVLPFKQGYIVDLADTETKQVNRYTVKFLKVNRSDKWYLSEQKNGHWYTGK